MRIPEFTVRNQRNIRLATCDLLPRVMIVTGPNGCGKTTLLDNLRRAAGAAGPILYVGPHRTSRRQQVQMRYLSQPRLSMRTLYSSGKLPGFEGIDIPSRNRDAWGFDEASSFLKYGLCQIELDRQTALTERFDRDGEIEGGAVPDIWEPLREMAENLLPHLHFHHIDVSNRDQIRCLWRVHAKDLIVDIDELSSGEKSIIQLFFPLIEHRIYSRLDEIKGTKTESGNESVCVLMDEPELHLHPILQGKILDYIRIVSIRDRTQFILATHSTIIVEHANSDELFLLRPSELTPGNDNQLFRIATNEEKLVLLRDVFGSTANLTAMRPILVVEGQSVDEASRRPADARIFAFLSDRFNQLTLLPSGGRSECSTLAQSLTEILKSYSPHLKALALVDRDLDEAAPVESHVVFLPVSMIENFLVDPEVIWSAIVTVRHKTKFTSSQDVEAALDAVLDEMKEHECARRIKAAFGSRTFRLQDPVAEAGTQLDSYVDDLKTRLSSENLTHDQLEANRQVQRLIDEKGRREHFDGKEVLSKFFRQHMHATGMSREIFVYELAKQASTRRRVRTFVRELFDVVGPTSPSELSSTRV